MESVMKKMIKIYSLYPTFILQ